jgi:hypothetical protein
VEGFGGLEEQFNESSRVIPVPRGLALAACINNNKPEARWGRRLTLINLRRSDEFLCDA